MTTVRYGWLAQPETAELRIEPILHALADPIRLQIVRILDEVGESTCTQIDLPIKASTVSHHMKILREAGVTSTKVDGNSRPSRLRRDDLEHRFPNLLAAVIAAAHTSDTSDW